MSEYGYDIGDIANDDADFNGDLPGDGGGGASGGGGLGLPKDGSNPYEDYLYNVDRNYYRLPDYKESKNQLEAALQYYGNRTEAPSLGSVPTWNTYSANDSDFRGGQTELASVLRDRMYGNRPSVAELQLNRTTDRNLANQMAMASSARGNMNPGLALRQAMMGQAGISQEAAGQAAMLRAQEQMAAEQALGGVLSGARGQDVALNQFNASSLNQATQAQAGMQMQTNLANLQAYFQHQGMNDAQINQYMNSLLSLHKDQRDANMSYEQMRQRAFDQAVTWEMTQSMADEQAKAAMWGSLFGGAGKLFAALSDERAKTNIAEASDADVDEFLGALKAHTYKYKDSAHGKGTHLSPMAQDLEKSKLGKSMVEELPNGLKMVNYGKGLGAIVAAQARLNEKLKALEELNHQQKTAEDKRGKKSGGCSGCRGGKK